MKNRTKKLVMTALLAALVFIATFVIRVPMPSVGYVNLGDCMVLLCGWILGPVYGFLAAGIGSALADVCAGWMSYVPVTFGVKALMALAAYYIGVKLAKEKESVFLKAVSAVTAEVIMILGYLVFEGFLYGFGAALVNVPFNAVQGAFGIVAGLVLINVYNKTVKVMLK